MENLHRDDSIPLVSLELIMSSYFCNSVCVCVCVCVVALYLRTIFNRTENISVLKQLWTSWSHSLHFPESSWQLIHFSTGNILPPHSEKRPSFLWHQWKALGGAASQRGSAEHPVMKTPAQRDSFLWVAITTRSMVHVCCWLVKDIVSVF